MDFEQAGFIESLLSRILELTVHNHLEDIDCLKVDVASSAAQLLQGKADAIYLEGQGLQAADSLHVEHLSVQVKRVAIALVSMAMGKLELTQPARLTAQVVLSEDDLNAVIDRADVKAWIREQPIVCGSQSLSLAIATLDCTLPAPDTFALQVRAQIHSTDGEAPRPLQLRGQLRLEAKGQRIYLEEAQFCHPNTPLLSETTAILTKVNDLLHRRSIQLDSLSLHIQTIAIQNHQLVLRFTAEIKDLQALLG
ncbi:MAG: DUF2993 domain-containing protein [Synechococcales bacterium]|nr:DUF2993 domain-containing protein [Synechococcales bacterium]